MSLDVEINGIDSLGVLDFLLLRPLFLDEDLFKFRLLLFDLELLWDDADDTKPEL